MKLLCFDPGLTTGFAWFEEGDEAMKLTKCGHLYDLKEITQEVERFSLSGGLATIVNENFARGNSVVKEQIETIRLCGGIEALAHVHGFGYAQQYPASRTGYVPIAKAMIKELGFGTLQENHHAIDAIAHGLCYMDKEGMEWQKQYWMQIAFR